LQAR
jgi:hypothetical protein